jgi:hypothetical protein
MPFSLLRIGVIISFALALASLIVLIGQSLSFGKRQFYAKNRGSAGKGLLYAFGRGMTPWEKESAGKHLPTFTAGILYHCAIFSSLIVLFGFLAPSSIPVYIMTILRLIIIIGMISGLGLLIKRFHLPHMKAISCLDDFLANLIVDLFLALAISATLIAEAIPFFLIMAIILFLYIPMGKIRHCFFFFYTRILFGISFGRRGVFPHPRREA